MPSTSYLLHELVKELTNSNASALFVGNQAKNIHDLKTILLNEISALVENTDALYLTGQTEYADINISFSQ